MQYAHSLKEQRKYLDAELYYRQALALGAPADDVLRHLEFVAREIGSASLVAAVADVISFWERDDVASAAALDFPLTVSDVKDLYELLHNRADLGIAEVCEAMRHCPVRWMLVKRLVGSGSFPTVHRDLLRVIRETCGQA